MILLVVLDVRVQTFRKAVLVRVVNNVIYVIIVVSVLCEIFGLVIIVDITVVICVRNLIMIKNGI